MTPLFLLLLDLAPWQQFGLAGLCFAALLYLVYRLINNLTKRDKEVVPTAFAEKAREELLSEIEKRETRLIDLQEKTLTVLSHNSNIIEKVVDQLGDLIDSIRDLKNEPKN